MLRLALSFCVLLSTSSVLAARQLPDVHEHLGYIQKKRHHISDANGTPPTSTVYVVLTAHLLKVETCSNPAGDLWALLVAGSAGWGNYRHQADVAHSYQVLRRGGVPDERIIVMVYDDVASSTENPRPGTIINHPLGPNNYAGMPIDYKSEAVNADTFIAVLKGNKTAVCNDTNSCGRVIEAGPNDRIFVFYSDHGAPGILGMPTGDFLYADKLHDAIRHRHRHQGFGEMVLYIEACESGSIFEGLLEDDIEVYATTAANGMESSWGTYCPGMNPGPPPEYSTCLGDLYSVAWMEDADSNDLTHETLKKQFQRVRQRASQNYTYAQGSHVQRFGELELDEEAASRFLGDLNVGPISPNNDKELSRSMIPLEGIPQREADLVPLIVTAARLRGTAAGEAAQKQLEAERRRRAALDASVLDTVVILKSSSLLEGTPLKLTALGAEALLIEAVPAPHGSALVSDWDCLRGMVGAWSAECGPLDQYGMRHSRLFANLCNLGVTPDDLTQAAEQVCSGGQNAVQ